MHQEILEIVNRFNQTAYEASKQLADINARNVEKLLQKQLAFVELSMQGGIKQLELMRDFKDLPAYMSAQEELAKEYTDKLMATTKDTVAFMSEARDELNAWLEQGVATATATLTPAKPAPTKKAA